MDRFGTTVLVSFMPKCCNKIEQRVGRPCCAKVRTNGLLDYLWRAVAFEVKAEVLVLRRILRKVPSSDTSK